MILQQINFEESKHATMICGKTNDFAKKGNNQFQTFRGNIHIKCTVMKPKNDKKTAFKVLARDIIERFHSVKKPRTLK